ncbi:MAG: DUF2997 domain-containing protein [Planctomycetota bacterium]|nr:MAG: DUF2997 domain-containing protein [Planctomycetota bacterium]
MKTIEVTVRPDGSTRVRTRGFWGAACRRASRFLERTLGRRLWERRTPEFYERPPLRREQRERDGA